MDGELERRKKKARTTNEDEHNDAEDRISTLPDELIHQILKYVDTKLALQTSVLSKRWELIWTTLPFLSFKWSQNLTRHVLSCRNQGSNISKLKLAYLRTGLTVNFIRHAISRNVQYLNVRLKGNLKEFSLSNFSSKTMKKLSVRVKLKESILASDCWDLPALTTLKLSYCGGNCNVLEQILVCLPALTTLCLRDWDLKPCSFSLPALTTLVLSMCRLPNKLGDFASLKSLVLKDVRFEFPESMRDIFATLGSLQNLTLSFHMNIAQDYFLNCPHLVNLEIKTRYFYHHGLHNHKFVVLAPKLRTFTSVGIFPITFEDSELDSVYIKLRGWIDQLHFPQEHLKFKLKRYHQQFKSMLSGLGSAKTLNLELETIKALSLILDFLVSTPSPFHDLKYVKLPYGCKEESISNNLRRYLLGGSPTATIVTTLPQKTTIPRTAAASVTAQNVVVEEPLAAPTEALVDFGNLNESVCVDTVDMGVQEEHVVLNSEVHDDRIIRHVDAPVEGTVNNQVSSSGANSDIGLWRGHEVKSEFVSLLNHVVNKYPVTFEHFATKNKEFCTMKLNMLCTTVKNFTKISMTEVDMEMISEYRNVFDCLQKFGFNISWLVSRLNYVEQLRFSQPLLPELHAIDCHIDDANSKLQDLQFHIAETKTKLQNLHEKMQEIQKAFGTMGTSLAVGYIGDDLLPSP